MDELLLEHLPFLNSIWISHFVSIYLSHSHNFRCNKFTGALSTKVTADLLIFCNSLKHKIIFLSNYLIHMFEKAHRGNGCRQEVQPSPNLASNVYNEMKK